MSDKAEWTTQVLGISAATALIILCTLLPFLPGSYDPLAMPLSMMARVFGFVGLLLVPIGGLWMAARSSHRLAVSERAFTITARIASVIVLAAMSLVAWTFAISLGVATAIVGAFPVFKVRPAPLFLVVVPLAVFGLQMALLDRAVEFSRTRGIQNASELIAAIERYRAERGKYPPSLLAIHRDYKPSIIGIDRYQYEPSGEAYNLIFEQPSIILGTQEFVAYNPLDQQQVTAHPMDILEYAPAHLERTRGYHAVHTLPHPHWKYFWFD